MSLTIKEIKDALYRLIRAVESVSPGQSAQDVEEAKKDLFKSLMPSKKPDEWGRAGGETDITESGLSWKTRAILTKLRGYLVEKPILIRARGAQKAEAIVYFQETLKSLNGKMRKEAFFLGRKRYQVGDSPPLVLQESEDFVLRSLIDLGGAASLSDLRKQTGKADCATVLRRIKHKKKYKSLAPFIILPGSKGKGGYRTTIRRAD